MTKTLMTFLTTFAIACSIVNVVSYAQTPKDLDRALEQRVGVIAKRYADSVVVRWAPSIPALWTKSKVAGYRIERAEVQGERAGAYTALTDQPVKPWTPEQWDQYGATSTSDDMNIMGPIAVAALLSDPTMDPADYPTNDPGQLDALRQARSRFEMAYGMAMLAAERSADAATGLGMRFVDKTARAGVAYRYRVTLLGDTKPYVVGAGTVDVGPEPTKSTMDNTGLSVDELDRSVLIKWNNTTGHSTYDVFRSRDGLSYEKLTQSPMLTLRNGVAPASNSYLDSNLTNYSTAEGLPDHNVNCVLEDRTGRVWFATSHAGVCYLDGGKVTAVTAAAGVHGVEVWDLFEDRQGHVWFPVENSGVYRFDGRSFRNYSAADGLDTNAIQYTHQDAAGRIWLGGYRGLFRVDGERVVAVTATGPWR